MKPDIRVPSSEQTITPGIYKHYKGHYYEVFGVSCHSETLEQMVVYRALYEIEGRGIMSMWCRPLNMFLEEVTVEGEQVQRFTRVGDRSPPWF